MHPAQLECLRPREIYARVRQAPIAWLPLGAIEWHGWHAPVGLDGHTAHGLCLRAAEAAGGVVLPPVWAGLDGTIAAHPWTILEPDPQVLIGWLRTSLHRLEQFGLRHAIVVSGHFALTQIEALTQLRAEWDEGTHAMGVRTVTLADCPDLPQPPDHGGRFETALLQSLRPELIDMKQIDDEIPGDRPGEEPGGIQRRDPSHPLYGALGEDPRGMPDDLPTVLRDRLTDWLIGIAGKDG